VALIVTDFSGNQESDNITITVLDVTNPVSNAGQDIGIRIEEIMTFNGNLSSDNVAIILFEWDFGDGIKEEGIEVTHFYLKTQTYNVSLTVFDERGYSNTDWMLVTVNPASHNTNLLFIAIGFILLVILVFVFTRFNPKKKTETKEIPLLKER
jgi:hypothetical protein